VYARVKPQLRLARTRSPLLLPPLRKTSKRVHVTLQEILTKILENPILASRNRRIFEDENTSPNLRVVTSLTQLKHRETYGQAQDRSGGHQGSSVNRRYQLSFVVSLWYRRSPLPQDNRLLLNVSVRYRPG